MLIRFFCIDGVKAASKRQTIRKCLLREINMINPDNKYFSMRFFVFVSSLLLLLNSVSYASQPLSKGLQTEVRDSSRATTVINLSPSQAFILYGFSISGLNSNPLVTFERDGQKFVVSQRNMIVDSSTPELYSSNGGGYPPLRGPGTISISGYGLVTYEVVKVK